MASLLLDLEVSRNAYGRQLTRELGEVALDPRECLVLRLAVLNRGVSVASVRNRTAMAPSTVSSVVNRLEADGLVRRGRYWPDRRVVWVEPTRFGQAVCSLVDSAVVDIATELGRQPFVDLETLPGTAAALEELASPRRANPLA